jgi:hypothetical protein
LLLEFTFLPHPAHSVQGGQDASGSPYVVGLVIRLSDNSATLCSGALVAERIIVTAGHCVVKSGKTIDPASIRVFYPGAEIKVPMQASVQQIFVPTSYKHLLDSSEPDDIAFLVFDNKIGTPKIDLLANSNQVKEIVAAKTAITFYGYGITGLGQGAPGFSKSFPLRPIDQLRLTGYEGKESTYINYAQEQSGAACNGDSGGPAIAQFKGSTYLVSVHSASKGVCSQSDGLDSNWGTIPGEYLDLYQSATSFVKANPSADLATPSASPTATPAPMPTASPSSTPSTSPRATPSASPAKKTITCIKGKVKKKVTAVNPKCPAGYKKL